MGQRPRAAPGLIGLACLLVAGLAMPASLSAQVAAPAAEPAPPGASGLPVPRFVSLKSDRVNLRRGPGTEYPIAWVFRRAGMPVEVLKEAEGWRQVRDAEGATGWVLQSMLSGRRTALVLPWEAKEGRPRVEVELRADDSSSANVVARVEAGVIAAIRSCDRRWCHVVIGDFKGYLEQTKLWGIYEGETIR
jgi:SH3-like domain-containing protein